MSAVLSVMRRELQAYFVSPIAYAFMVVFLLIVALAFTMGVLVYATTPAMVIERLGWSIRTQLVSGRWGLITWGTIAALLSLPGLSMRLLSEEKKSGTAELLFTSPITTAQIVAGKYLGSVALYALILVLTFPMPAFLMIEGRPEVGALACAYLGLFLFGAVVLAVGVFASSMTENQFIALLLTYALMLPFILVEFIVPVMRPPLDHLLAAVSVGYALKITGLGMLDSCYLVLHAVIIAAFLFLAARVIDSARWR
jgi:ABC-2 type transport system permease protein